MALAAPVEWAMVLMAAARRLRPVLVPRGPSSQHLGAGVGVDGGHEAGLDAELLVQQLDHGGHGVGGAGTGGDDHVGSLEDVVVHAEHNGRGGVILGRGGDQDLLGASVDVSLGLLGGGVEAGALEHVLNTVVLDPRNVVGVLLGVDLVFLAVDDDGVFGGLDVNRSAIVMTEGAVGAVVLQQVSQGSRGGQIVDGGNFNVTSLGRREPAARRCDGRRDDQCDRSR